MLLLDAILKQLQRFSDPLKTQGIGGDLKILPELLNGLNIFVSWGYMDLLFVSESRFSPFPLFLTLSWRVRNKEKEENLQWLFFF